MSWKTGANTNIYLIEEVDGKIPVDPELQPHKYSSCSLEGSYETITSDTKLPGRIPQKNLRGTDTNAGDLVVNLSPLEYEKMIMAVLCSENGFVKNDSLSDTDHAVYDMIPGNKQRTFALLKEFSQEPKLYQIFKNVQFNSVGLSFTIGSTVKATFNLMGANNPELEEVSPVSLDHILDLYDTEEFITLQGSWKFKGPDDPEPIEYIDGVDINLNITNNMSELKGLFQKEAIDKTLGMLEISGTINEYVKDGKLYNLAKKGEGGELYINLISKVDEVEYLFILNISFDNSTLSGDDQLQYALPFTTYGENRFILRKIVKAEANTSTDPIPVTGVSLNQNTLTLNVSDTYQLIATVTPSDADNKLVIWESDDVDIATVDNDGNVSAIAEGTTEIAVKTIDGNFTDTCIVEVTD